MAFPADDDVVRADLHFVPGRTEGAGDRNRPAFFDGQEIAKPSGGARRLFFDRLLPF